MGKLHYGGFRPAFELDDRPLAHLHYVIASRLNRNEGCFVTWRSSADEGGGRISIWIDSRIPIHFTYSSRRPVELNRRWLDELLRSSHRPEGLVLTDEPVADEER